LEVSVEYKRATFPAVIVRLDRATQYSGAQVMESKSHGILGPRIRGDDGFLWSSAVRHISGHHGSSSAMMALATTNFPRLKKFSRSIILVSVPAGSVRLPPRERYLGDRK
jgi:hypothetical protein